MMWINRLYIFFIGIILTLTTGFGIAAFYPEPQAPIYPTSLQYPSLPESCLKTPEEIHSPECAKLQKQQEKDNQEFQEKQQKYQNESAAFTRTTIFFGISIGAIFTILSLTQMKKNKLIANGLILAGVLTMLLTRLTVSLASFGAEVTGTEAGNTLAYAEFGILVFLSALVIYVGMRNLTLD